MKICTAGALGASRVTFGPPPKHGRTLIALLRRHLDLALEPSCVGCIYRETSVIVRGAVRPPHWTAFPERALYRISFESRGDSLYRILSILYRALRGHEVVDEFLVRFLIERWIAEPPKASPYHKISAVGRACVVSTGGGRFGNHAMQLWEQAIVSGDRDLSGNRASACRIVSRISTGALCGRVDIWLPRSTRPNRRQSGGRRVEVAVQLHRWAHQSRSGFEKWVRR